MLPVCAGFICCCCNLKDGKGPEFLESYFFSSITVTNLGSSRAATQFRLGSTYINFVVSTIILIVTVTICNTNPEKMDLEIAVDLLWSELPIVQEIFILNLTVLLTISSGVVSLMLDLLFACILGWEGAILHEGVKYKTRQDDEL